jgi:hypothetical protein
MNAKTFTMPHVKKWQKLSHRTLPFKAIPRALNHGYYTDHTSILETLNH